MDTDSKVSGIVLAGGMSRRLGRDKAVEPVGGEPLLLRVIGRLSKITDHTVVVVGDEERAAELPIPERAEVAADIYPGGGSLGGIFTGLTAAEGEWGVAVACDMPFLSEELLGYMLSVRDGFDAVVPILEERPEPTHAVYSKRCLPFMEARLKAGDLKIARFFDQVRVNFIPQAEVEKRDPEHLSFFNVNTQQDLDRALALVEAGH